MAELRAIKGAKGTRRKFFTSGKLLIIFLALSIGQYYTAGQVTWLTDSFRWIEVTAKSVWANPVGSLEDAGQSVVEVARKTTATATDRLDQLTNNNTVTAKSEPQIAWSSPAYDLSGRVVRIADGDTLTILDADNRQHKIRLYGIDTPESGQPFGNAAKRALSDLVAGEGVGIDIKDTDRYGRTVGVVYLGAKDINLEMVKSGYAWWYKKYAPFSDELREAEQRARAEGLGLWAEPDPIPPWEWRRGNR